MNCLVSVIVPVYNARESLLNCVSSICKQTYSNLEIILVDDGSDDGSYSLCKQLSNEDKRIISLHQSNQGVSSARNIGLRSMHGDYIMFVDADDYLKEDACERLLYEIKTKGCDVVLSNKIFKGRYGIKHNTLYDVKELNRNRPNEIDLFILDLFTHHYDEHMNNVPYLSCGVTAKIFSSKLINSNNIEFDESCHFGEDVLFNMECFQRASSIIYIDYDSYVFCNNASSSTHRYRKDWKELQELFVDRIDRFVELNNKDERFINVSRMMRTSRISALAVSYFFHKDNPNGFFRSYREFVDFINENTYKNALHGVDTNLLTTKQKVMVYLLNHHMETCFAFVCWGLNRIGG